MIHFFLKKIYPELLLSIFNCSIVILSIRRINVGSIFVISSLQKLRKSCVPTRSTDACRIRSRSRFPLNIIKYFKKIKVEFLTSANSIDRIVIYNRIELIYLRILMPMLYIVLNLVKHHLTSVHN
jgi:hypothetical protein